MKPSILLRTLAFAFALLPLAATAKDRIKLPLPWQPGLILEYASVNDSTKHEDETLREHSRSEDTTRIRVLSVDDSGIVQEWSGKNARYRVLVGDKSEEAMMKAFYAAMASTNILVRLDRDGVYERIDNIDEISGVVRSALTTAIPVPRVEGDEAANEKVRADISRMTELLSSPAVMENQLRHLVETFNTFPGANLEDGQWYELTSEAASPFGGKPIPVKFEFALSVSENDPEDVFVEWNSSIDPERGRPAVVEAMRHLLGDMGSELSNAAMEAMFEQLRLETDGFILIHRPTGLPEMFEHTRTNQVGNIVKTERMRLRLMSGGHGHNWREPGEADEMQAEDDGEG